MKKIVALTLVTAAMALAGCDMPDKLEKPNPVAEWTWTGNPKLDNGGTISLNLGGDGNFKARSTPPGEEARSVEGRWTVGESWNEKACGDRISLSDEDRLTRTADGKVGKSSRIAGFHWFAILGCQGSRVAQRSENRQQAEYDQFWCFQSF